MRILVGQLDVASPAVTLFDHGSGRGRPLERPSRDALRRGRPSGRPFRDALKGVPYLLLLAVLSMAHVGSPDTFFGGKAGPYDVRVSVRLPGVIPGRAQVTVRVEGVNTTGTHRVAVRAGQWNVGLKGAPPPEDAAPVPGDPSLFASELWFMTANSYELGVTVDGPEGHGDVIIPVLALATAERQMPSWLGSVLAALGVFLTAGLLTIIGAAVRESRLAPGVEPDDVRRRRARIGIAITAILAGLALWGGNVWWTAEANSYKTFVLYRPFNAAASLSQQGDRRILTLSIRDPRWTGRPIRESRYNALIPDHGKLMHLFLVREREPDAVAHLHPIAHTPAGLDFDADVPPLPAGRYRVYADIVHESGYAQTLIASVDLEGDAVAPSSVASDPDDSWFTGAATPEAASASSDLGDGTRLVWDRGTAATIAGVERDLRFAVRDGSGANVDVEPYMGMAAHLLVTSLDGSVFAHLHPSGSISMAAMQHFAGADPHADHAMLLDSRIAIPYAFPKAGRYRLFVQVKREGKIRTAAFDVDARP